MRPTFQGHVAVRPQIGGYDVLIDPFLRDDPRADTDAGCRVLASDDALDG
jgi:L-ascorbate metabolism protein UlaG (beta-lactamase superfamily)